MAKLKIPKLDPFDNAKPFYNKGESSSERDLRRHLVSILSKSDKIPVSKLETVAKTFIFNLLEFRGTDYFRVSYKETNSTLRAAFRILQEHKYLENFGFSFEDYQVTRYKFTPLIVAWLTNKNLKVTFKGYYEKQLKDRFKKVILTDHSRYEVIKDYIALMAGSHIRSDRRVVQNLDLGMTFGPNLETKGRIYYGLQTMSKPERRTLTIDGKATSDKADAKGCHIRFLYALAGYDQMLNEDPYSPPGLTSDVFHKDGRFDRDIIKILLLTAINAKDKKTALKSMLDARKKFYKKMVQIVKDYLLVARSGEIEPGDDLNKEAALVTKKEIERAYDTLLDYHWPIKQFLQMPVAGLLQFWESEMMIKVMERLIDKGVKHLPIHDGLVVMVNKEDYAVNVMKEELGNQVERIVRRNRVKGSYEDISETGNDEVDEIIEMEEQEWIDKAA